MPLDQKRLRHVCACVFVTTETVSAFHRADDKCSANCVCRDFRLFRLFRLDLEVVRFQLCEVYSAKAKTPPLSGPETKIS